jgi:hypothetical protein
VVSQSGPLENSFVEVEFSADAERLIAWCIGQTHPVLTGLTNASGEVDFDIYGGGCIRLDDYVGGQGGVYQVEADTRVLLSFGIGEISSPDAVNSAGLLPTDSRPGGIEDLGNGSPNCEDLSDPPNGQYTTTAGLSDAVFHTGPIARGENEVCSQFAPPFDTGVDIVDAVLITPYLKLAGTCDATGSVNCP